MIVKCNIDKYHDNYLHLPELDIKMLWHDSYYDGPLNGMCEFNNNKCWFVCIDMAARDDPSFYRRYLVIKLTDMQIYELECLNTQYCLMGGYDCSYCNIPKIQTSTHQLRASYMIEQKSHKDFEIIIESDDLVLGWFD